MAADPRAILALLTRDDVLRVLGALVLQAATEAEISSMTRLPQAAVARTLAAMRQASLVERTPMGWSLRREAFEEALRSASARPEGQEPPEIRAFFHDGRLRELPAQRARRVAVLRHIGERFEPGRDYSENEINVSLSHVDDDFATLRRFLVDDGILTRERGVYRRA